nr:ABC transporter permease [candidate division Zixibacteria bacterium]
MIRSILALIKKEFYQVIRDRNMLLVIFLMPLIQLLLLGYAVNVDVKNIDLALYDHDGTAFSREYIRSFTPGGYFRVLGTDISLLDIERGFKEKQFGAAIIIPQDFEANLETGRAATVGFMIDGTNANSAAIALGYANMITAGFGEKTAGISLPISFNRKVLFNPEMESVNYMIPGIVATLLTMITVMLTSMAIVREREMGTLEQLMVTPLSSPALILGKTIPFAILGYIEMSMALVFGILWFKIPFAGSWLLLYSLSFVFLFTTLGVGMFLSTVSKTQQQAMFYAWFFSIFAILTSGFFTPIANMPRTIQYLTYLNPLRYFMIIVRGIMMKASSVSVLYPEILALVIFGIIILWLAWIRFSKRIK